MSPSVSRRSPMGRHGSRHSVSPVRGGSRRERSPVGTPRRSSASGRDRSPAHHKSFHRDSSPKRERHSSRPKSPKREKSTSPVSRSPSPRTKRLRRAQAERETEKAPERARERDHARGHERSPKREKSNSPVPRSPSPRTKRLRRAQAEREAQKAPERARDRVHERGHEKSKHRERDAERDGPRDRKERRPEREVTEDKPSRSRHGRSASPSDRHRSRNHSHSPPRSSSRARAEDTKSTEGDESRDDASDSIARMKAAEEALEAKKQKPSFEYSGKLAEESNRVKGVTLLFNEPPDARKPSIRWRLYVFKGGEALNDPLYVHRQSCYLFGRERRVADIPTDHPSCSKQHAVLQYRHVEKEKPDGTMTKQTRPYIMDLGSTNKTFINDNPIEPQRYYELFEKDTIKFGNSSREYVLLHENSLASNDE